MYKIQEKKGNKNEEVKKPANYDSGNVCYDGYNIFTVSADETTDLSDLKVYAIDNSGNQTEVPLDFNSTTYDIT